MHTGWVAPTSLALPLALCVSHPNMRPWRKEGSQRGLSVPSETAALWGWPFCPPPQSLKPSNASPGPGHTQLPCPTLPAYTQAGVHPAPDTHSRAQPCTRPLLTTASPSHSLRTLPLRARLPTPVIPGGSRCVSWDTCFNKDPDPRRSPRSGGSGHCGADLREEGYPVRLSQHNEYRTQVSPGH